MRYRHAHNDEFRSKFGSIHVGWAPRRPFRWAPHMEANGPQARRAEIPQRGDAAVAHPSLLQATRHDQALRVARNGVASGHVEDGAAGTSQTKSN